MSTAEQSAAREKLAWMINGYRVSQMIIVAAKLGIADALANGPLGIDALAAAVGAERQALFRVLRGLASMGVFRLLEDGRFEQTPLSEPLRSDFPDSLQSLALSYGEQWWWDVWGQLHRAVHTGETAFNLLHGESMFEYLEHNPAAAHRFNAHMVAVTETQARSVVAAYDFSSSRRLCDIGGGHGALLREILQTHPHATAVLFDRPSVIAGARDKVREAGMLQRCELVAGDFFKEVPGGADTYILKSIIHDWRDPEAATILRNCRRAMPPDAKLLLLDHLLPPANEPSDGRLPDITMLVMVGGQERSEPEYRNLLRCTGFRINSIAAAAGGLNIIEALPV